MFNSIQNQIYNDSVGFITNKLDAYFKKCSDSPAALNALFFLVIRLRKNPNLNINDVAQHFFPAEHHKGFVSFIVKLHDLIHGNDTEHVLLPV